MDGGVGDCEEVDDVFSIAGEFHVSVREGERNGSDRLVPGDRPVSSILDEFGGLNRSKSDFHVPELFCLEVVVGGSELATEYCVKTDCSLGNNVLPLRIWELGAIRLVNE